LLLGGVVLVAVALVVEVGILNRILWPALQSMILRAHAGESLPWINALFDWFASGAAQIPAWSYVDPPSLFMATPLAFWRWC
jgi:hypothetical protein